MPISPFDNTYLDLSGDVTVFAGSNVAQLQPTSNVQSTIGQFVATVPPVVGNWYPNYAITTAAGGAPASVGQLHAYPFVVGKSHTFNGLGIWVTTAGSVSTVRFGVYADSGSGTPGSLVVDLGTTSANSSAAAASVAGSILLPPGVYYNTGVVVSAMTSPTFLADTSSRNSCLFGQTNLAASLAQSTGYKSNALTFTGALPSVFPTAITAELSPFFQILA